MSLPSTGSITIEAPVASWIGKWNGSVKFTIGAGRSAMTALSSASLTSATVAKFDSTQLRNSHGASAVFGSAFATGV
ncbi:hypothetical protein D3C87_1928020 [compost metagenome]